MSSPDYRSRLKTLVEHGSLPQIDADQVSPLAPIPPLQTDRDNLFARLERIREEDTPFDDEARVKGLRCVAVPIVNNNDTVERVISVFGPTSRFQGQRCQEDLPATLKNISNVIELNITYTKILSEYATIFSKLYPAFL